MYHRIQIVKTNLFLKELEPCDKLGVFIKGTISDTLRLTNLSRKRAKLRRNAFGLKDRILQSKNAFSPSAALRAAACKARVALGRVQRGKRENKKRDHLW